MILFIIILVVILMIVGFFYIKGSTGNILGGIATLLLLLSMFGLIYHDNNHWGMKEVTKTTQTTIYSAAGSTQPFGMLLTQAFGTNSGNYILMYKAQADDSKTTVNFIGNVKMMNTSDKAATSMMKTWISDEMSKNVVESSKKKANYQLVENAKNAKLVTKTTTYQWDNNFAKFLFGIGGESGELIQKEITAKVPKETWLVLTPEQAQQLQKLAPEFEAKQKAQLEAEIAAAKTPQEKQAIAAAAQKKQAQMAALKTSNPDAYAKLMVSQMKTLLGIKD
ncbi:DUF4811 domain-containing protein [Lactococcus sp.]|uniref:DUF4811 domain-containing protein n=1 Tax=Lactococcus sp. TaxID=44273 RepID=UPI002FCAF51C